MKPLIYAPIMIPTLCRYEHFVRCIESLKKNSWASKTDVYVALDYPANESHWDGYKKILDYLNGDFSEFAKFYVFKRESNYGAKKNNNEMTDWILKRYDRYIVTDDDIEFSQNFLEYMDKCLQYYEDDEDVVAISGYSYPLDYKVSKESTVLKINCECFMWGTGFWKNKYIMLKKDIEGGYFTKVAKLAIQDGRIDNLIDARKMSFSTVLFNQNNFFMSNVTDIATATYLGIAKKWVVIPVLSKSRNWGCDGSGIYCRNIQETEVDNKIAESYDYSRQIIDENVSFDLVPDTCMDWGENAQIINSFDVREKKKMLRVEKKIRIYKICPKWITSMFCYIKEMLRH